MRTLLLASAAVLALGGTALAQNAAGNPRSAAASNITSADTHSRLAPALPSPGADMSPDQLLTRADQAVRAGHTGLAQSALEEAETRLLTRATTPSQAGVPDNGPRIDAITKALHALASRDKPGALSAIQMAMGSGGGMQNGTMGNGTMGTGTTGTGTVGTGTMNPGGPGGTTGPANPNNGLSQGRTALPNGVGNNPVGQSGGGGNESSGPIQ